MKIKPFLVHTKIPDNLRHLHDLTTNLWFSWNFDALEIFIRLGSNPFRNSHQNFWEESGQNPVKLLSLLPQKELVEAGKDESFVSTLNRVYQKFQDYLSRPTWFSNNGSRNADFLVAYFSCEFGLDQCFPLYSGGLGILSGDHLKSASDLGIPLVGVGLLYQEGYFQQYLNNDGWQQEQYPTNDWYNMPVSIVYESPGKPLIIDVQLDGDTVYCQVWRVDVGRTKLYLLDTNIPMNPPRHREISNRLYGGDRDMRIRQEIILGMGGVRALKALDIKPTVFHINEGHSAFLSFERIRQFMSEYRIDFKTAWEIVWASNVFTTHTPVPAGNEVFALPLIEKYFPDTAEELGLTMDEFIALGQEIPGKSNFFSLTVLALRMSAFCNGVSRLHSEISRNMWHVLWKDIPVSEVPIAHITNGVHTFTWTSNLMQTLFEKYLGPKFKEEPEDPTIWQRIDSIPDNELWRVHQLRRERCIAFTREHLASSLKKRGAGPMEFDHAREVLNPHALTIGFARRFASYKRATLLFHKPERLAKILNNSEYPVQIIFAGKAHPQDNPGKELIRKIVKISNMPEFRDSVVFLENYDMHIAKYMIQGCDIWLNTPRRPLEASGTSGMKAALNGVLNVSILDGWWCEGYQDTNGWVIGSGEVYDDPDVQDDIESDALYRLLENDIVPYFYERDRSGLPRNWIKMMKNSMKNLGSFFNTHRMLIDYTDQLYFRADKSYRLLTEKNAENAKQLAAWRKKIDLYWPEIILDESYMDKSSDISVGDHLKISILIKLGHLTPEDVTVEAYFGLLDPDDEIIEGDTETLKAVEHRGDVWRYECNLYLRNNGRCGYAVRVMPHHPHLVHPFTPLKVKWE